MKPVFAVASNITSSLGLDTASHWKAITAGKTGISRHEDASLSNSPFFASIVSPAQWQSIHTHTRTNISLSPFEQMAIFSARQALQNCEDIRIDQTILVLSTTKGNIEWLGQVPDERIQLAASADIIATQLGLKIKPVVISHACASGVVALQYGLRLLQQNRCKNVIVLGCDRFSRFVLSGFQSFQAVANEPCKPFDADRTGITLGEAAAAIILSTEDTEMSLASLLAGSTSNDANHISGPSRTGAELAMAINNTLAEAGLNAEDIDTISAHGTATLYNDEMESKAFALAGLTKAETHSLKGYIGHTLGAAGVAESAMLIESMRHQQLVASAGYAKHGVPEPIRITRTTRPADIRYALKTASGFGGCNAAIVWQAV